MARTSGRAPGRSAGLAAVAAAGLLLGACTGGGPGTSAGPTRSPSGSAPVTTAPVPPDAVRPARPPVAVPVAVATSVADRATGVAPDRPVSVSITGATAGRLESVVLTSATGSRVAGTTSVAGSRWTSDARLAPATRYVLTATAVGSTGGAPVTTRRTFSTVRPAARLRAFVAPLTGSTVGVGMPLIVTFSAPVYDRAAVERALVVTASRPVPGSWSWIDDSTVHYRPATYWPARTTVRLRAELTGVDAGDGVWGVQDRDVSLTVGRSLVDRVDLHRHTMAVYQDGRLVRQIPITGGKDGFTTRSGIKVVMEKDRVEHMDAATIGIAPGSPNYYVVDAQYAMRVTNSGEFIHGAPWSAGSQGSSNVSHGCVGMSTADARWLFDHSLVGDVVTVTGSRRTIEPGNGWSDWNETWAQWTAGSALRGSTV